jgi:hypothetical protein
VKRIKILILTLGVLSNIANGQIDLSDLNDNWSAFVNGTMTDFENQSIIIFRNYESSKQRDSLKKLNIYYKETWSINNDSLSTYISYYGFGMTVSTRYVDDRLSHRKFLRNVTLIHRRKEEGEHKIIAKYKVLDLKKEKLDITYSFGKKDGRFKLQKLDKDDIEWYNKELILKRKK